MNHDPCDRIIGKSKQIVNIKNLIKKAASFPQLPVLITGETGTGKELVAEALHQAGSRVNKNFVAINCSAIPEMLLESTLFGHRKGAFTGAASDQQGLVEKADKGTLFLDEIGDMDIRLQPKLLRFLENGKYLKIGENRERFVDVRIITATNKNLLSGIKEQKFRKDLFYRLKGFEIDLPPLRQRLQDIPPLTKHFLNGNHHLITSEIHCLFSKYHWPGNIRELKTLLEKIPLLDHNSPDFINQLKNYMQIIPEDDIDSIKTLQEIELEYINKVYKFTGYEIRRTATLLGITRNTLKKKIKENNLYNQN